MLLLLPPSFLCCVVFFVSFWWGGSFRSRGPPGKGYKLQFQHLPFSKQFIQSFDFRRGWHPCFRILNFFIAVRKLPFTIQIWMLFYQPTIDNHIFLRVILLSVSFGCIGVSIWGGSKIYNNVYEKVNEVWGKLFHKILWRLWSRQ